MDSKHDESIDKKLFPSLRVPQGDSFFRKQEIDTIARNAKHARYVCLGAHPA